MDDGKDASSTSSDAVQATGNGDQVGDDAADVAGITASAFAVNPPGPSPFAAERVRVAGGGAARRPERLCHARLRIEQPPQVNPTNPRAPAHHLADLHEERDLHHRLVRVP